jgi:ABC-type transporter lipoprotein component MlaA
MFKHSNRSLTIYLSILLFLTITLIAGSGCSILRKDKQAAADKKQAQADKKASAEYEKARVQYYKRQNKETKKMMKNTRKKAAQYNKPMKRKGLFKAKCD